MLNSQLIRLSVALVCVLAVTAGCQGQKKSDDGSSTTKKAATKGGDGKAGVMSMQAPKVQPTAINSGFAIFHDGKVVWVFSTDSEELKKHMAGEELAKHTTKLTPTGGGISIIKAPDMETITAYRAARPGFVTRISDGYLWVFYEGSAEQQAHDAGNELAKHTTSLKHVDGKVRTIKAPSMDVIQAYLAAKPGYAARHHGGYLWVFEDGSEELAVIDAGGELAKHSTKLSNVNGKVQTIKALSVSTIDAYLASHPGFVVRYVDDYMWVFKEGSPEYFEVIGGGELAKHATTLKNVGGKVQVLKAPDTETINAYLASRNG